MSQYNELVGLSGYFVSDDGRIFHNDRELKTHLDKDGYVQIGITVNRKTTTYKVHRLVAKAFLPNPMDLPEVNHIDGNKANNKVSNLEWVSHKRNLKHASDNKLFKYGEEHHNSKISQEDANEIRRLYVTKHYTQAKLADMFKTTRSVVCRIVNNKTYLKELNDGCI